MARPCPAAVARALGVSPAAVEEFAYGTAQKLPRAHSLRDVTNILPGEQFISDPIGRSLREGVKALGKLLFALTGSVGAMQDSAERVCNRDRNHWSWRASIIEKRWNGIGDGNNRWHE